MADTTTDLYYIVLYTDERQSESDAYLQGLFLRINYGLLQFRLLQCSSTSPCDALETPSEGPRSSGLRSHTLGDRRRQHELLPRPLGTPLKLCVLHMCNQTPSCSSDFNNTRREDETTMSDLQGNKSSLNEQCML